MRRVVFVFIAGLALAPLGAMATPPPALDLAVYGRLPNIELMRLSPSGERLAYLQVNGDDRRLVIKDLVGKTVFAGSVGDNKIRDLDWAGEDHLVITATATQRSDDFPDKNEWSHTIVADVATQKVIEVFATSQTILRTTFGYHGAVARSGHWYGYFAGLTLNKTRGFDPSLNSQSYLDLYRVDLDTGATELAAPANQKPSQWALDTTGAVIAHSQYDEVSGLWTLRTGKEGGVLASLKEPLGEIGLEGMGRTPDTVIVDKAEPEELSLTDGGHKRLEADRLIDGYIFDPDTWRLVGVRLAGDRSEQEFFDPVLKARQSAFAKALGGSPQLLSWSADRKRMILYTEGDGDAGTYWLVDGREVKPYAYAYPEIPDANIASSRMITYKAADGLEMRGVLTLPPGRDAKNLPLVVMPHGGPEAHDSLGFDWWAQAFAGRGYAVFQPNFRGSSGYGLAFRDAGFGQWGRKMQTDVSDGVAALIRQGLVDPKRACIVGASYGGYVALAGVTVQHGLYRCAVAYGGISDLNSFLEWFSPAQGDDRNAGTRYTRKFLGARGNDDKALHDLSPARLADQADAPILLIHGVDDTVVPIAQARKMEHELQRAGKPEDFVLLKGEDHWLSRDATRKAMLEAAIKFVERYDPAS